MTVNFTIARLKLKAPIHLSKGRIDPESSGELLHSDTLMSALIVAGLELFGSNFQPEEFLKGLSISSAFPFFKDEVFFPKPRIRIPFKFEGVEGDAKQAKKAKKLTYLGKCYFKTCLQGNEAIIPRSHLIDNGVFVSNTIRQDEITLNKLPSKIIGKDLQQRVRVPKPGETVNPDTFYIERIYYHPEGGLFFLIYGLTPELRDQLAVLLRYLGDKGLGKNRTFGFGQFEFTGFENLGLEVPDHATNWTNLSLYCPSGVENTSTALNKTILSQASYSLIKRGGWISSPEKEKNHGLRKKSIYMFQEGSVFPFGKQANRVRLAGKAVNLQPDILRGTHPIWRDGRALFLPIKIS